MTQLEHASEGGSPHDGASVDERCAVVCRMGAMMLAAGTASYRVKLAMGRVAQSLGIEALEAQVTLNEIVVMMYSGGSTRTQVIEVAAPVVNADRIAALMRVSLVAGPGLTVGQVHRQLDAIENRAHLYPEPVICLAAALACAAFACLNHGDAAECLVAGVAAALGKGVQLRLRRLRGNPLVTVALSAAAACGSAAVLAVALGAALPDHTLHQVAMISATLFLVPGFPLLTAVLDLARFDFAPGASRLAFAFLVTVAAGVGIWPAAALLPLPATPAADPHQTFWVVVLLRVVASFVGVLGFAVTFNTPARVALAASLIGAVANVLRLAVNDLGASPLFSALAATTLVGLLAAATSHRLLTARITLSVPAVLVMVPGTGAYLAILATVTQHPEDALEHGLTSLTTGGALAAGLVVARMLTDPAWVQPSPDWAHPPRTRVLDEVVRQRAAVPVLDTVPPAS